MGCLTAKQPDILTGQKKEFRGKPTFWQRGRRTNTVREIDKPKDRHTEKQTDGQNARKKDQQRM